jgi:hypothetical protein
MQNSADEEVCSFCSAKLKPVQLDPDSGTFDADLPDWLNSLRSFAESSAPVSSQRESLPDLLGSLPDQPTNVPVNKDIALEDREDGSSAGAVDNQGGTPDWLKDFISDMKFSDELGVDTPANGELIGEEKQWLSRIDSNADESYSKSSETPDWLSELGKVTSSIEPAVDSEPFSQEIEKQVTAEGVFPIGISDAGMIDEVNAEMYGEKSAEESLISKAEVEYPGTLETDSTETESLHRQPFILAETEFTDQSLGVVEEPRLEVEHEAIKEAPITAPNIEQIEKELFPEMGQSDQTGGDLEWLDELEAASSGFHPETDLPISEDKSTSITPGEQKPGDLAAIPVDTLPSWLIEAASEEEVLETPAGEKEGDSGLMPVELPSWLQAMRPIEATSMAAETSAGVELEKAEVAGPLTGLRGALPAEPDISQTQKPSSYSIKLQVTETQQSQASLLEEMIHSEGEARPVSVRPVITTQHVLRIFIAVILILSVLIPLATGIPQVGLPVDAPGISSAVQSIGSLSAGTPVLLSIDYSPGFSGEMDAITALVVDHLMRQGAYFTVVSTTPTGPAQAERLIASVNQEGDHAYGSPDRYINLGFIPGGPLGLLRFSGAPRQVLPRDIHGKPAWNSQPINRIEAISGYSMIIVATENPDTARSWIEQVQPSLKDIPLILVVSSQAEPLVRPYYEAVPQQIQGLVGGLAGGISYQSQIGKNGRASLYWPSFSLSMMFAGLLIVIGGLVNLAFAYKEHRKEGDRKER